MSLPLCKAAIETFLSSRSANSPHEATEEELFVAKSDELARKARHKRFARLQDAFASVWTGAMDRLFRTKREAKREQDLLERLESFPPYLLEDIGVARDTNGRFIFEDALGLPVDIATGTRPGTPSKAHSPKASAQMAGVAGE